MRTGFPMRGNTWRTLLGLALGTGLLLVPAAASLAGNWPGWRGPTGVGWTDEKDLVLSWNGKTGENIVWKVSLAGTTGHSSPIIWGDRLFITTAVKQTRQQEEKKEIPQHHLLCLQTSDGKLLWQTLVSPGPMVEGYNIYAVPTPVTDGQAVYCWFGSAVMAAVDFDGKLLWREEREGPFLQNANLLNPGICSTPALYQDTVILQFDQGRGGGCLQALDKKTGKVKWEKKRTKMDQCNTTPLLLDVKGNRQLIVAGSNLLQGLDPASGEPIWWCKSWGFGASPAYAASLLYTEKGNEPAQLVDPTGQGDVTATHVKWKVAKMPGDYASPVIVTEYIYKVQKEGVVACLKLATGEQVFTGELEGVSKLASPIATADGRLYFVSTGKSYVIKAGPTLEVLGKGDLGGYGNGSSAAVAGGRIFIRDFEFLYCLGKKP